MTKFKYNDKVLVIKDDDNEGFFIGFTGFVNDMLKTERGVTYTVCEEKDRHAPVLFKEDQLQKI